MNNELLERISELNILVIGDIMLDRYITGTSDRISPEAPVPVVRHKETENRLGGAANVALNVKGLGAEVSVCAIRGTDENGELLERLIQNQLGEQHFITASEHRQTTVKTRVIAHNQHLLRVDREDIHPLSDEEKTSVLESIDRSVGEISPEVIILQDYNKGLLQTEIIERIISQSGKKNIYTAVDPKFEHFFDYRGCTLFKPNLREIRQALQRPIAPNRGDLDQAANELLRSLPHQLTCVTLSEQGLYLRDDDQSCIVPTTARNIVDVCGAGDAVIAVLSALLPLSVSLANRGKLANIAGGQVCEKVGVVPVDGRELMREYGDD